MYCWIIFFDIGVTHAAGVLRGNSLDVLLREVLRVLGNELLLLFRTQLVDVVLHHGTDLVLGKYVLEGTHYCLLQQIPHILEQSRLRFAACIPRIATGENASFMDGRYSPCETVGVSPAPTDVPMDSRPDR